jgi:hypothetical protein
MDGDHLQDEGGCFLQRCFCRRHYFPGLRKDHRVRSVVSRHFPKWRLRVKSSLPWSVFSYRVTFPIKFSAPVQ